MSDEQTLSVDQSGYSVGYRKPPKASQWPKGHSGNAAGKKKGDKSFAALFRKVAKKMVPKKIGNKTKMVSFMELLVEASFVHGAKGNTNFGAWVLKVQEDFGTEPPGSSLYPKPGQIYRDSQGNPKIDLQWIWNEELSAQLKILMAEFGPDPELSGTEV